METHRGLAVFVSGEILAARGGNGGIARNYFFYQAAHGLDAERERNHIQQQHFIVALIARQHIGLNRRAERDHFIRIEIGQRLLLEERCHRLLYVRHARGAADHDHAFDIFGSQAGITQRFARRRQGFLNQAVRNLGKNGAGDFQIHHLAGGEHAGETHLGMVSQLFFHFTRLRHQQPCVVRIERC